MSPNALVTLATRSHLWPEGNVKRDVKVSMIYVSITDHPRCSIYFE